MLVALFLLSFTGYSQFDQAIYNLRAVPQTNLANPAFIPAYQYHFGVPGLSSVYAQYSNSGIKFNQLFSRRADDSLDVNFSKMGDYFKNRNTIGFKFGAQWLNGGMKWKDFYFNFSLSDYVDATLMFSDDLGNFLAYGNGSSIGQKIDFAPSYLKATHYREYAFGAAWDFDSQWNFGAKIKMLFGKSNVHTKVLDASLFTAENTYNLTTESNILINSSLPHQWFDGEDYKNSEYLFYGANFGMGFDFGATYKLDDIFSFSASVLDLGWMQFDRNYVNLQNSNVTWTFEGIDALQFQDMTNEQVNDKISSIGDSLLNKFALEKSWNRYNMAMTAKIYLAANYKLSNIENIGVVLRSEIINKVWRPAFTATYYRQILDDLGVIGAYTMADRSFTNIGVGAYYNYKFGQVYLVTENIIGLFVPDTQRHSNIHFGINIIFPDKKSGTTLIDF